MRTALLSVLVLAVAGSAGARENGKAHKTQGGCVIDRIEIKVAIRRATGLYHLTAVYRARDGRALTQTICPDQNQPSWSLGPTVATATVIDRFGYEALAGFYPGTATVRVVTTQGHFVGAPDPVLPQVVLTAERSFEVVGPYLAGPPR
jgi:hypothetical protein